MSSIKINAIYDYLVFNTDTLMLTISGFLIFSYLVVSSRIVVKNELILVVL